ncbi:MAG: hypothetical protein ACFFDH_09185 [Promethearchaeota archaeon]
MKKTLYKSILILSCLVLFGGSLSIYMITAPAEPSDDAIVHNASVVVFDHYNSNWNHPAIATINIPCYWEITSCRMEYDGYCDPDDYYVRAIGFWLDWRGSWIGSERTGPFDVWGYGIIYPGQTKHWEFDMSYCQFAKNWSDGPGSVYWNFIPQDEDDKGGYFSPGEHTITAFVSSQDFCAGATQDSWISITLYFEYLDPVGDILNQISSNQDELKILIEEKLSGWSETQCEKYLHFSRESVDNMIETHLNCGSITAEELFILNTRFQVIKLIAGDQEISDICDNTMALIDELEDIIGSELILF